MDIELVFERCDFGGISHCAQDSRSSKDDCSERR
jgi:hypothetical protein